MQFRTWLTIYQVTKFKRKERSLNLLLYLSWRKFNGWRHDNCPPIHILDSYDYLCEIVLWFKISEAFHSIPLLSEIFKCETGTRFIAIVTLRRIGLTKSLNMSNTRLHTSHVATKYIVTLKNRQMKYNFSGRKGKIDVSFCRYFQQPQDNLMFILI